VGVVVVEWSKTALHNCDKNINLDQSVLALLDAEAAADSPVAVAAVGVGAAVGGNVVVVMVMRPSPPSVVVTAVACVVFFEVRVDLRDPLRRAEEGGVAIEPLD
jgi:hypothetical protein